MAQSFIDLIGGYWFWGGLGFLAGGALAVRNLVKQKMPFPAAVILITLGIYGGLLFSRIHCVLTENPRLFFINPFLALAFWQGSLYWQGGAIGGVLVVALGCLFIKRSFWETIGAMAPPLALAHAICRFGCLSEGCCYGRPCSLPWAIYSGRLAAMVHPTQVYSMAAELLVFIFLQWQFRIPARRKYLLPAYGILFATHRFVQEFYRGVPPGPEIFSGLRVFQSICIFIFVFSLAALLILRDRKSGYRYAAGLTALTILALVVFRPASSETIISRRNDSGLYLVATRSLFQAGLEPWIQEREKEGFDVVLRAWGIPPEEDEVRQWLSGQMQSHGAPARYILVAGDYGAEAEQAEPWHMPSVPVSYQKEGADYQSISDSLFGDADRNGIPEIPVGRWTVRTRRELDRQVQKSRRFRHREKNPGWYRTVIWSGAAGYTRPMNSITLEFAAHRLPQWLSPFIISGDTSSPYSGLPEMQPEVFLEQIQNPAFLSLILSHGSFRSVTPAVHQDQEIFLSVEDVQAMPPGDPGGPLWMLGCNSGKFHVPSGQGPCLAEAFLVQESGPIAVIAANGPTRPLTNYFLVLAMLSSLKHQPPAIGDFLLAAQHQLCRQGKQTLYQLSDMDPYARLLRDSVPEDERPKLILPGLARYQALLYQLIGDPSCPLDIPDSFPISVHWESPGTVLVEGQTPEGCNRLTAEWIAGQDAIASLPPDATGEVRREAFRKVNPRPLLLKTISLEGESWSLQLKPPQGTEFEKGRIRLLATGPEAARWNVIPSPGQ